MRIILLLSLFVSSFVARADELDAWIRSTENNRRALHKKAFDQIASLNYFRMKILAMESSINGYLETALQIQPLCTMDSKRLSECRDRADSLYSAANDSLSQIYKLGDSDQFKTLAKGEFNSKICLEKQLNEQRDRLLGLTKKLFALRVKVGQLVAQADFAKAIAQMDKAKADIARLATCKPTLSNSSSYYVSAMTDLLTASSTTDPFLILRSEQKLRKIRDDLTLLAKSCPEVDSSVLRAKVNAVDREGWHAQILPLVTKACARIGNFDSEANELCKKGETNESAIFYLHTVLVRMGGLI